MSNDFPPSERYLAIREGHFNVAIDEFFEARSALETPENRRIFYAGHCKGYDAAMENQQPIDMVLFCPNCGKQHIDAPDNEPCKDGCQMAKDYGFSPRDGHSCIDCEYMKPGSPRWTNPPHRSHLCHSCGCIWRPADVPTNGVAAIKTKGKDDTWVLEPIDQPAATFVPAEKECADCKGTGSRDSGGSHPWGEAILLPCDCGAQSKP